MSNRVWARVMLPTLRFSPTALLQMTHSTVVLDWLFFLFDSILNEYHSATAARSSSVTAVLHHHMSLACCIKSH